MATVDNYKIKIEVQGEEQVVDLMDNLDNLQSTLNKTATAGIAAFSALATSAVMMADDMVDLANATGISVGAIYQLSTALEASGGKFDDSGKFLQAFSRTLGDVEKGSSDAINSLTKLGLSRDEIATLSDEALFREAVNGLANMEDGFARTELAMSLFGKSAASVDFKKLAEELGQTVDPELERNLLLAAGAVDKIEASFRQLQLAALEAIAPILTGIKDINFTAENAKNVVQVLGSLIAAAFAASTVVQIAKIVKLIKDLGGVTRATATAMAFLTGLSGIGLAAVAAAGIAATAAYVALGKAMEGAADEKERLETPTDAPTTTGGGRTVGVTPEERALAAVKETTRQMRERNAEANRYQQILINNIGRTEEEASLIRTMADLERSAGNEKLSIQKQIDAELAKGNETNKAIVVELQNQLTEVDKQLAIQKQLKLEEQARLNIEIARKQFVGSLNQDLLNTNKQVLAYNEKAVKLNEINGLLTAEQARRELDLLNLQNQQANQLNALEIDLLNAKSLAEELAIRKRIDDLKNAHQIEVDLLKQRQELQDQLNQSATAGAVDAMANISKQFEPYKMAQDAILQTWSNISSAVDQFVQTGKFKFSDFAKSVLRDLAAMILKAQILFAIKKTLGFFGLSIPGLAEGGPAKAGQPYIVGEKGPELFVPKSAGTVIPNGQLMADKGVATGAVNAPVTNNYITNNINAIDAKSVAQLFAENRKTLLGSVKMAEREMPYMAR